MNLMSLAELLDRSLDILRKYIKSIVMFSLGYGILMFIIIIPVIFIVLMITLTAYSGIFLTSSEPSFVPFIILFLLAVPLIIAFSLSYYIGLIKIASQDILKEKVLAQDAIKASFKSFFKVLGIGAAGTVLSLPVLAVFGVILYFIVKTVNIRPITPDFLYNPLEGIIGSGAQMLFPIAAILLTALLLVFILSALMNYFSFSLHALTIEKLGVIDSIKRSLLLIKGSFWRVFGCMLLFYFTVYAITTSFQSFVLLVSGLIYLLLQFLSIPQDVFTFTAQAYNYTSYPISILSWLVISPIGVIMSTLLYYNRRFAREGFDMVLKLEELRNNTMKASIPSETDP